MSDGAGVELREAAPCRWWNLRADHDDAGFRQGVAGSVGLELPVEPCTWRGTDDARAYWLGPDEWLLMFDDDLESRLGELRIGHSVVDVSGGHVLFSLRGPDAGKVMQKSSPYDFHPRNFRPGRCVQTVFAKTNALVAANRNGSLDLVIRRSYADYARQWIADAGAEYGLVTG